MSKLNTFHDTGLGVWHLSGKIIDLRTFAAPEIMAGRGLDLIRADVEGYGVEVFCGLIPAIERDETAPMIIFEPHLFRYSVEHDIEAPLQKFLALGYRLSLVSLSWDRGKAIIEAKGYSRLKSLRSDGVERTIYEKIGVNDAIAMICRERGHTPRIAPSLTAANFKFFELGGTHEGYSFLQCQRYRAGLNVINGKQNQPLAQTQQSSSDPLGFHNGQH